MKAPVDEGSLVVNLPDGLLKRVKAEAARSNRSESSLVADVLNAWFDDEVHEAVMEGVREADAGRLLDFDNVDQELREQVASRRAARAR